MATQGPAPVDTGAAAQVVVRPLDRSPAPLVPGPGTTGQIPTIATPQGPPESAPPAVAPGPGTGQSTGSTAAVTPAVIELSVDTANTANADPNIIPTVPNYIEVLANGVIIVKNSSALNFTGSGVTVTANGAVATINISSGGDYGNSNVATLLAGFGSNTIVTTGNISGGYFIGNGSQLTGITTTYGNANVSAYLGAGQVGNIIPLSNAVYSLGNVTNQWAELYVSNNSIVIGGVTLSVSAGNTLSVNGDDLVTNTALGVDAGGIMQGYSAIAIGTQAGNINQGLKAIAIGDNCGRYDQSANAIAIGAVSGRDYQGTEAVAFGRDTGLSYQGNRAMAMGTQAGSFYQGQYAIAFGYQAGRYNQGANSVAIGAYAGIGIDAGGFQGNNSIVINATGANLTNQTANTFTVAPVRNLSNVGNVMFYNAATSEITYGNTISVAGNITGGNITGGNILTGGLISATGNITGAAANIPSIVSQNLDVENISARGSAGVNIGAGGFNNLVVEQAQVLIQNVPLSVSGNITGGNLDASNLVINNIRSDDSSFVNIEDGVNVTGDVVASGSIITPTNFVGNRLVTITTPQVGSSLVIDTGSAYGDTAVSIASDPTLATTYPAGSTITFQDGDVRTIVGYDNYPGGTDIFWTTAKTGTLFPITLKTADYAPALAANASIAVGSNTWTFTNSGNLLAPGAVSAVGNITGGNLAITGNTATITTANYSVGYLNIPQISFAANATAALVDSGKHYYTTSASNLALTLADNSAVSWPVGTALSIVNRGTANVTVAPADGVSLYLAGNATTGNRTVTTYGMATVMNVASNVWMISGTVV